MKLRIGLPMKVISIGMRFALLTVSFSYLLAIPAHSAISTYFGSGSTNDVMNSYSVAWDDQSDILYLASSWNNPNGKVIDQVEFLINDGGVPDATKDIEQFLYYDLDLVSNVVQVREYYGDAVLGTYLGLIDVTSSSFNLKFDNSVLGLSEDSFSHQGRFFESDLIGEQIGIWHYLYSDGSLEDTYDVHLADTDVVDLPVTQSWILFVIGIFLLFLDRRGQVQYA